MSPPHVVALKAMIVSIVRKFSVYSTECSVSQARQVILQFLKDRGAKFCLIDEATVQASHQIAESLGVTVDPTTGKVYISSPDSGEDTTGKDTTKKDAAGENTTGEDAASKDMVGKDATGEDIAGEDTEGKDTASKDIAETV